MCSKDVIDLISSGFKGKDLPEEVKEQIKILTDKLELRKETIQAALNEIRRKFPESAD